MNNVVFEKNIENVRKHRDKKLTAVKKKDLFSIRTKLSYYKNFQRKNISNEKNEKNWNTYE